jgi:hypothetical protein
MAVNCTVTSPAVGPNALGGSTTWAGLFGSVTVPPVALLMVAVAPTGSRRVTGVSVPLA